MISLRGKRALVTGGSRGIGAETALLLADCGADGGIAYRSRSDDAAAVARRVADRGVRSFAHAADVTSPDAVAALFDRADREFIGLDIVVGNAGTWPATDVSVAELGDDRWQATIRTNLDGVFFVAR